MDDMISRAAAIAEVEQWAEHGYDVIHWTGIKAMLEVQPTVPAIPVEWLEKHDDEDIRDSDGNSYGRRRISVVEALSMWKKEQEAQT